MEKERTKYFIIRKAIRNYYYNAIDNMDVEYKDVLNYIQAVKDARTWKELNYFIEQQFWENND